MIVIRRQRTGTRLRPARAPPPSLEFCLVALLSQLQYLISRQTRPRPPRRQVTPTHDLWHPADVYPEQLGSLALRHPLGHGQQASSGRNPTTTT